MHFHFLWWKLIQIFYVEPIAAAIFLGKVGHIGVRSHSSTSYVVRGGHSGSGPHMLHLPGQGPEV